jgi:hypothetical protein
MTNIGDELTALETRLNIVEQHSTPAKAPSVTVTAGAGGTPVIRDSLTFDTGWIQHTKLVAAQPNPALANYPNLSWVHYTGGATPFGPAQAIRVGNMCFLTGMVVRSGATVPVGQGGGRMFMLPIGWRPKFSVMLSAITDGGSPGYARIDVQADLTQAAGGVYFIQGTGAIASGSGWLHLSGAFPCSDVPGP